MRRLIMSLLIASLAFTGTAGCVGSFALTRTWDHFINNLGNKWISSVAFVLAVYFRFYLVVLLVDMILLNSVEFWGGKNPVIFNKKGEHRKSVTRGDERVEFTRKKFGREMEIRVYKKNRRVNTLLLKKGDRGVFYIPVDGRWEPMGIRREDKNGRRVLHIMAGSRRLHSRAFSGAEYAGLLRNMESMLSGGHRAYAVEKPASTIF